MNQSQSCGRCKDGYPLMERLAENEIFECVIHLKQSLTMLMYVGGVILWFGGFMYPSPPSALEYLEVCLVEAPRVLYIVGNFLGL